MTRKSPGAGHIRERKLADGTVRYSVLVKQGGKQLTVKGGLATFADAEAWLASYHVERERGGFAVPSDTGIVTVRRLGVLYLASLPAKKLATDTSRWRARVEPAEFIDWPVSQLSEQSVRRWIAKMATTPIDGGKSAGELPSRSTLQNALNLLRGALRWAVIHEHLDRNPAANVTIGDSTVHAPRGTAAGDGYDYLTEAEVRRILEAPDLPLRQRTAFVLLAFTGARPKDLYLLTWDRVDVAGGVIRYRSHKRSRDYVVHLLPVAQDAIRKWWMSSGRPGRGLVFVGPDGKPHVKGYDWGWADVRGKRSWKKHLRSGELKRYEADGVTVTPGWRTKIGIRRPLPLYSLRHTCASHLLLGTELFTGGRAWSLEEIASVLGHADMSTVRRYAVALNIASKRAVEESRVLLGKARK